MGESPKIRELRQLIQTVAPTEARVLILGESGTGKELVARALYQHGPRVKGQFLAVGGIDAGLQTFRRRPPGVHDVERSSGEEEWLRVALAALVSFVKRGGAKRLAVERFDGEAVSDTMVMPLLVEAGFLIGPRRAVFEKPPTKEGE